jgi:hypothetical protein
MDRDLLLLMGVAFLPLALVAFVSAWADRRAPWAGAILLLLGVGMAGFAQLTHPDGGYDWRAIPMLAIEVAGRLTR